MKVYTYFHPVPGLSLEDSTRLLLLWKENWKHQGFEPFVLNEEIARNHKRFVEFEYRISKFPTVNRPEYERSCYLRYLAMQEVGGGLMVDYDLFYYGGHEFPAAPPSKLNSYQQHVPSCVCGDEKAFARIVKAIYTYEVTIQDVSEAGVPHVSDMYIFLRNKFMPYTPHAVVKNFGEPGWEQAPLVHFANGTMRGLQPRWKHIQQLRNWK